MKIMDKIYEVAKQNKQRIVLPEGEEERNIIAAKKIHDEGIATIIMIGDKQKIKSKSQELGVDLTGIDIINPIESDNLNKYIDEFYELRKKKGMTREKAEIIVKDSLYFGTMMVKLDDAEGMVSGDRKSVV